MSLALTESEAAKAVIERLEDLLRQPVEGARRPGSDVGYDLVAEVPGGARLLIEVKSGASAGDIPSLSRAWAQIQRVRGPEGELVLAVPYMTPRARAWAAEHGVSWLDLSGNADIHAPGLRIVADGRPNRFTTRGRPSTVFSARASRISRVVLVDPARRWSQAELVKATGLSRGFVSKVVRRMLADRLLEREPGTDQVFAESADLLLDAWAQRYRFDDHTIRRFHVVARSGAATLAAVSERLSGFGLEHAATGLAGAWLWSHFADFRLTTFFVEDLPDGLDAAGIRSVERGENLWLAIPQDAGVFAGAEVVEGVRVVHPVQCWLDLQGHHERARDAAERLRSDKLRWTP